MSGYVLLVVAFLLHYFSNVSAFNGRCPTGWTFFEHSCYKRYTTPKRSFPVAQSICESLGASLTSISSAGENQFIHEITESSACWIGLNDIRHEGIFQWMDGTQFRYSRDNNHGCTGGVTPSRAAPRLGPRPGPVSTSSAYTYCHDAEQDYSKWSTKEPNNAVRGEDCVHLTSAGYWNDLTCASKNDYMCEKEANREGTLAETTITCPHSFETVFELGASKTVTWSEPAYLADSLASHVERSHSQGAEFRDGVTWVNYTFKDAYDNMATCNFSITVLEVDTTPPKIVLCPSDVSVTKITNLPLTVTWEPPEATDLSDSVSLVSQNHFPGDEFEFGANNVTYKFTDDSGNEAVCFFRIYVIEVNNNIGSAFEGHAAYESHDLVNNGLINGLYIFLGCVGLTLALLLLFVIKVLRMKNNSGVVKQSYARMNDDSEVDIGI